MDVVLGVAVVAFWVVTGANDGASVLAASSRVGLPDLRRDLAILALCVAVVPWFLSGVAVTFTQRLVTFGATPPRATVLVVLATAIGVVGWLARRGEPTSLTLGLVGALAGAGAGSGGEVVWTMLGFVLMVAAAAPFVGGVLASLLMIVLARVRPSRPLGLVVARLHRVGFTFQSLAYAANDGQKLLAVAALALPAAASADAPHPGLLLSSAVAFAVGTALGMGSVARKLASGVVATRPLGVVVSEFAASISVLLGAAVAAPVSMTQAVAGALLGSDLRHAYRGVRWREVARLVRAWVITLPLSFLAAAVGTVVLRAWS